MRRIIKLNKETNIQHCMKKCITLNVLNFILHFIDPSQIDEKGLLRKISFIIKNLQDKPNRLSYNTFNYILYISTKSKKSMLFLLMNTRSIIYLYVYRL